jgi:hypothetical protein
MYNILQKLYVKFKILINSIFETISMRSGPEYDKLSDDDNSLVYFDNPMRK